MRRWHHWMAAVVLVLLPHGVFAQTVGGVLVIDQDRMFSQSQFGAKLLTETERASAALASENRQIEAELIAEERALTDQRPDLSPEEFRALADAFDEKVQRIRAEQSAKGDGLGTALDEGRRVFFQATVPVLADILRQEGAVAILDKRTVLISVNAIDVTERAVAGINQRIGDGNQPPSNP